MKRRIFVLGGVAAAGAGVFPLRTAWAGPAFPFRLGVASGDPGPDRVVLWTRLAPSPLNPDGHGGMPNRDVDVEWQVSTTDTLATTVSTGTVTARYADAHSVHVIAGGLKADSEYYYRFRAQGHLSPVARTRTAPAHDKPGRDLVMAFASCANFEHGYFTAYQRMADEHPDLILHLGDYIYEGPGKPDKVRQHAGKETVSLADYRLRYAQYKEDADLQAAHAAAPWLVVPDDHEIENDVAGATRGDPENDPPMTKEQWAARRAAAYQAYYENMPLASDKQLYRRIRWGTLATFHMLDTRQFRDPQACGNGWKKCADADKANRSITGAAQEAWLLDGFTQHYATWDVVGQQVFFARRLNATGAANMDTWDGYRASRNRVQRGWLDRKVRNPVVLTGDIHTAWANDLKAAYADAKSPTIGTELVCTSITSRGDGTATTTIPNAGNNPHLRFYSDRRGYVRTRIRRSQIKADFRALDAVTKKGAAAKTLRSFTIEDGRPGLR
jgi:alkaline phosphatase D